MIYTTPPRSPYLALMLAGWLSDPMSYTKLLCLLLILPVLLPLEWSSHPTVGPWYFLLPGGFLPRHTGIFFLTSNRLPFKHDLFREPISDALLKSPPTAISLTTSLYPLPHLNFIYNAGYYLKLHPIFAFSLIVSSPPIEYRCLSVLFITLSLASRMVSDVFWWIFTEYYHH